MKIKKKKQPGIYEPGKQKALVLPSAAVDTLGYFTREEAKMISSNVMKGGLVLVALGVMSYPEVVSSAHEAMHVNAATHANRGAQSGHINVAPINQHTSMNTHSNHVATSAHSNVNTHSSTQAINAHNSANIHANTGAVNTHASKPAINVAALHNSVATTKGNMHNSGSQGKHSAWTAHSNANTSVHANTAASTTHNNVNVNTHSSVNTHANTGAINTHASINSHGNSPIVNTHASYGRHANTAATNVHASIVAIGFHSNAVSHQNHNSHSSW